MRARRLKIIYTFKLNGSCDLNGKETLARTTVYKAITTKTKLPFTCQIRLKFKFEVKGKLFYDSTDFQTKGVGTISFYFRAFFTCLKDRIFAA